MDHLRARDPIRATPAIEEKMTEKMPLTGMPRLLYKGIVMGITKRQSEVLGYILARCSEGRSPTYREIMRHFGFKSPRAAVDHVQALARQKLLCVYPGIARGIEVLVTVGAQSVPGETVHVPLLGTIPAGSPEWRSEHVEGYVEVDRRLVGNAVQSRLFAVKARGDSMVGRGILDGDTAVAESDVNARAGDIVVALIDGGNTLKTLCVEGNRSYLKAENPEHEDLVPSSEMLIQGVVRTVIRGLR